MRSRSANSTGSAVPSTVETGRFAPSPTGPLHLGSLLSAVASWVNARASGGRWLVRIEDLDQPRCVPGASDSILATLEHHALRWDDLSYQHDRVALYRNALDRLTRAGHTFLCTCSRSQLRETAVYPGICRNRDGSRPGPSAVRVKVPSESIELIDLIQGSYVQRLDTDVGDFIIERRDGIIAYQLAVVVDDAAQNVTQVVRGADLLDNTPRQLLLFRLLGVRAPRYAHVPVLTDRRHQKLSKQTLTSSLDTRPAANLRLILALLGHEPPRTLRHSEPLELLDWAATHWDLGRVPRGPAHPGFVCI